MNPLTQINTQENTICFDQIKVEDFMPALDQGIAQLLADIDQIKQNTETPTFANVVEAMEASGDILSHTSHVFGYLSGCLNTNELQQLAEPFYAKLTDVFSDLYQDAELFSKVKAVYDQKDKLKLTQEQSILLQDVYDAFIDSGTNLPEDQKAKYKQLKLELSKLGTDFDQNELAATASFEYITDNLDDLKGIPEGALAIAKSTAKQKGHDNSYAFGLDMPSYIAILTYADNRELRRDFALASGKLCAEGDEVDNQPIVKQIVQKRTELAQLMGYDTYADKVLKDRMAANKQTVFDFIQELKDQCLPFATKDINEVKSFAFDQDGLEQDDFKPWDYGYYAQKLKTKQFNVNDEITRPYFALDQVLNGLFTCCSKLYKIEFRNNSDAPTYHDSVQVFDLHDLSQEQDTHLGTLYFDPFPRDTKQQGAWMATLRSQSKGVKPINAVVCNFTPPTDDRPSLLSFNEVTTLFHEFGHALHALLSDCTYASLSGTSVKWDFVELPSQIFENWCYESECLKLFATHYQTGELISDEIMQNLKAAGQFQEGRNCLRQLALATLDMKWHTETITDQTDVFEFETQAEQGFSLLDKTPGCMISTTFGHIFAGGYASGYYSYKWAEVLDADAFESFQENGLFDQDTAKSFKDNILSKGASLDPNDLYMNFKGRKPSTQALLKRSGFIS